MAIPISTPCMRETISPTKGGEKMELHSAQHANQAYIYHRHYRRKPYPWEMGGPERKPRYRVMGKEEFCQRLKEDIDAYKG